MDGLTLDDKDLLAKSIRGLTIAVCCLCLVIAAQVLLTIWSQIQVRAWRSSLTPSTNQSSPVRSRAPQFESTEEFNGFSALPLDQKIQRASVVVVTRFKREGDSLKAIITDIPKRRPATTFYYSIGQEFTEASTYQQANAGYGDGVVVFLIGNPASVVESYSYSEDRIGGLGGMPLQRFRELAHASK